MTSQEKTCVIDHETKTNTIQIKEKTKINHLQLFTENSLG